MKLKIYPDTFFKVQMQDDIGLTAFYNKSLKEKCKYRKSMKQRYVNWFNLTDEERGKIEKQITKDAKESFIKHCLKVNLEEGEQILKQQFLLKIWYDDFGLLLTNCL